MKLAATIIKGVCVECGSDLVGQKDAIKGLVEKYGAGNERVFVLYSSQRPAMRKRIDLPKGVSAEKLYAEGKEVAKVAAARRAKVNADVSNDKAKAIAEVKASRAKRRDILSGDAKKKANAIEAKKAKV
jgi:hypothetical protein